MTGASGLVSALDDIGVGLVAGVPCSYLAGPIRLLEEHPRIRYVSVVNEGSAVAVAAGAWLAGTSAAIIAQNSGFGNMINPLTSLVLPYRMGLLAIVSLRGWPTADPGEPQHLWMGRVIPSWLESIGISYRIATADGRQALELLDELRPVLAERRPAFLLVGKGTIGSTTTADPMRAASRPIFPRMTLFPPARTFPRVRIWSTRWPRNSATSSCCPRPGTCRGLCSSVPTGRRTSICRARWAMSRAWRLVRHSPGQMSLS